MATTKQVDEMRSAIQKAEADFPGLFSGSMVPEVQEVDDIRQFLYQLDYDPDTWDGVPFAARLQMPGYLDATDWTPIGNGEDFREWCEQYDDGEEFP